MLSKSINHKGICWWLCFLLVKIFNLDDLYLNSFVWLLFSCKVYLINCYWHLVKRLEGRGLRNRAKPWQFARLKQSPYCVIEKSAWSRLGIFTIFFPPVTVWRAEVSCWFLKRSMLWKVSVHFISENQIGY